MQLSHGGEQSYAAMDSRWVHLALTSAVFIALLSAVGAFAAEGQDSL